MQAPSHCVNVENAVSSDHNRHVRRVFAGMLVQETLLHHLYAGHEHLSMKGHHGDFLEKIALFVPHQMDLFPSTNGP